MLLDTYLRGCGQKLESRAHLFAFGENYIINTLVGKSYQFDNLDTTLNIMISEFYNAQVYPVHRFSGLIKNQTVALVVQLDPDNRIYDLTMSECIEYAEKIRMAVTLFSLTKGWGQSSFCAWD